MMRSEASRRGGGRTILSGFLAQGACLMVLVERRIEALRALQTAIQVGGRKSGSTTRCGSSEISGLGPGWAARALAFTPIRAVSRGRLRPHDGPALASPRPQIGFCDFVEHLEKFPLTRVGKRRA